MTDHPIIFSAPMILALLAGRKTMTRRLLYTERKAKDGMVPASASMLEGHPPPRVGDWCNSTPQHYWALSGWQRVNPGDRLWVKHAADIFPVYFKPIEFGDGKYAAGTDGNIYNLAGNFRCKPQLNEKGYERLSLRHNGEKKQVFVHTLIAEAFYGPAPAGLPECRHMNSKPQDNRPENLDWGTTQQNHLDMLATGEGLGERCPASKLTETEVDAIRTMSGTHGKVAEFFGINRSTVSLIKAGKRWSEEAREQPPRNLPAFHLWKSSLFMLRWASTISLVVTATKIERLNEISEADCIAEGAEIIKLAGNPVDDGPMVRLSSHVYGTPRTWFRELWDHLHGAGAWDANPELVALTFEVHQQNIDAMKEAA